MNDFDKYILARWAYSIGQEFISDYEWSLLHQRFLKDPQTHDFAATSWSLDTCPYELLKKYNLTHWMHNVVINTNKSESIPSITTLTEASKIASSMSNVFCSVKADGFNVQADYLDGRLICILTRGRSSDAIDASALKPVFPQTIPIKGKVRVYGEAVVPNDLFSKIQRLYSNVSQRSSVATALSKPELAKDMKVMTFYMDSDTVKFKTMSEMMDTLYRCKFDTVTFLTTAFDVMNTVKKLSDIKNTLGYLTDGCVVRPNELPSESKYAFRIYNWAEPYYKSFVTGYRYSNAPLYFGIQLQIYPVKTAIGSTQSVLDIDNIERILSNNLYKDSPVAFVMRSHAIADIDLDMTRQLQLIYRDNSQEYLDLIRQEEMNKNVMLNGI
jgi:hypothetical protein